ncbi:MAG: efflux RND transporter periplasmic adaptor subunit [Bacteroidales bacterium]|nr:efflux RND transporter periplasmic adaptor subunit [Bacteroidales bacterium]
MKTKKLLRYSLIAVVVLIVLAVVGKKVGWFGKEEVIEVAVEKAKRRDIIETITANGKIQPETEVIISPDVSGEIVDLKVREGDMVNLGQLLARIKPEVYISARDRSLASLNSSKARFSQAEAQFIQKELDYNRNKKLWEQQAISESVYETAMSAYQIAKAELDAAKYSVKSAEAALSEAQENLIKTSIHAPMAGTISMLLVEKGERVVGAQMMTGTEMMRIADLDRMEVMVEVNENDIVSVNMEDTALIEVDAFLGQKFKGIVTEIANSAKTIGLTTDQVTNFEVKIFLLRESYQKLYDEGYVNPFRPGMSATVDIMTEIESDVLSIPIQAVTTRSDSSLVEGSEETEETEEVKDDDEEEKNEVVFIVNDESKAEFVKVKTGIQDNNYIQILEGVEEDDEIITAPYNAISKKLKADAVVEVVDKKDLFKNDKKKKK